jgi:hypothetical protein
MEFGEYIYNDKIEYEELYKRPGGDWTIQVKIKFRCPDNRKIVVKYSFLAELWDYGVDDKIFDYDFEDEVTIINGSNPPDIYGNYTQDVWYRGRRNLYLTLLIEANLTAYEYQNGEWVKLHNDETFIEIEDDFYFYEQIYNSNCLIYGLIQTAWIVPSYMNKWRNAWAWAAVHFLPIWFSINSTFLIGLFSIPKVGSPYNESSYGYVYTDGKNGKLKISGSLYGNLGKIDFFTPDRFEDERWDFIGVEGFKGVISFTIITGGTAIFIGYAKRVGIEN